MGPKFKSSGAKNWWREVCRFSGLIFLKWKQIKEYNATEKIRNWLRASDETMMMRCLILDQLSYISWCWRILRAIWFIGRICLSNSFWLDTRDFLVCGIPRFSHRVQFEYRIENWLRVSRSKFYCCEWRLKINDQTNRNKIRSLNWSLHALNSPNMPVWNFRAYKLVSKFRVLCIFHMVWIKTKFDIKGLHF